MPAATIVELKIGSQSLPGIGHRSIRLQIHFLVFHASPEPLDKHVVYPAPLAVHADPDTLGVKHIRKRIRGKLTTLVGVDPVGHRDGEISGEPKDASASSSASKQNETSRVLESRQASTRRLAQSMIATR